MSFRTRFESVNVKQLFLEQLPRIDTPSSLTDFLNDISAYTASINPPTELDGSYIVNLTADAPSGLTAPAPEVGENGVILNAAPTFASFIAQTGPNGEVTFSGSVSDDQVVEGSTVIISGTGFQVSASVLADGTFSTTTTVTGEADILAHAQVTDVHGNASAEALTSFIPSPLEGSEEETQQAQGEAPVISGVSATVDGEGVVTITGTVSDDADVFGYFVSLTGSGLDTTGLVLGDGSFSISFVRPTSEAFSVSLSTVDIDENVSNTVTVEIPE